MDESYLRAWGKEGYCLGLKMSDRLHAQRRQRTWQPRHGWGGPHRVWRDHRLRADAVRGFQKGSGLRIGLLMFPVARAHFLQNVVRVLKGRAC